MSDYAKPLPKPSPTSRPFWEAAFRSAGRAVYAFASADSRSFIERLAVERAVRRFAHPPVVAAFPLAAVSPRLRPDDAMYADG